MMGVDRSNPPTLLVLASTYPRWTGDPEPGFVHELAKRLTGPFRVIVLCPHAAGAKTRETLDGVDVVRYRYAPSRWESLVNDGGITTNLRRHRWKLLLLPMFLACQLWMAWRLLRREKIDVIHAHWLLPQGLIAALLQLLPGRSVPFLVTSHGADLHALRGRTMDALKRFVLSRASAATVVSRSMRTVLDAIGAEVTLVEVRPMGVDMRTRFVPDQTVIRSTSEILFVGRLVEKKGLRHLVAAMPDILAAHPAASLTIAGFGPEEPVLRAQSVALGLQEKVTFIGAVPQADLPALYRRAAVFVAPFVQAASGDQEGLGLVLVEAIGCGCPVIAGDVPAVADLPVEAVRADAESLAAAIGEVLAAPTRSVALAEASRAYCIDHFDWDTVADGYARLLESASQGGVGA
jgi:glycosyltransferase involved in cell wall biosynthesis